MGVEFSQLSIAMFKSLRMTSFLVNRGAFVISLRTRFWIRSTFFMCVSCMLPHMAGASVMIGRINIL